MIRINTSDGFTLNIDLRNPEQFQELAFLLNDEKFQNKITGISSIQRYNRKIRCSKCKKSAKIICSSCGAEENNIFQYTGNQFSLIRPISFNNVNFQIENNVDNIDGKIIGGEKFICNTGNVQLIVMSYVNQPSSRITIREIGYQRFDSNIRKK